LLLPVFGLQTQCLHEIPFQKLAVGLTDCAARYIPDRNLAPTKNICFSQLSVSASMYSKLVLTCNVKPTRLSIAVRAGAAVECPAINDLDTDKSKTDLADGCSATLLEAATQEAEAIVAAGSTLSTELVGGAKRSSVAVNFKADPPRGEVQIRGRHSMFLQKYV
jgi:hypothetical protein